jgi:phosphate transport system substrate-binding protein
MKARPIRIAILATLLGLTPAACSPSEASTTTSFPAVDTGQGSGTGDRDPNTDLPVIDPFEMSGRISTAGSSTVFPLSEAVLELLIDEGGPDTITIDSIGSGAGFERFCVEGESDIANASRPIKSAEVEQCRAIGREPIEFRVGTDALAVTVSASNPFAESITLDELVALFSGAKTWAEVNPDWPAHPIALFSPGTDSGTFDYFVEEVFGGDEEPILDSGAQLSEDDNVLVQGIANDGCAEGSIDTTCAVGYFGYAYFVENSDVIRALAIEDVEPNAENVNMGTYPLARPLSIYSAASIMDQKPHVAEFIAFYLNRVNEVIGQVGYFPAPTGDLRTGAEALADAMGW